MQLTRHHLATVSRDCGLVLDRHTGLTLATLPHPGVTHCLVNPHQPRQAVTAGEDGKLRYWRATKTNT